MKNKLLGEIHIEVGVSPLTQSLNFGYPSEEMERLLKLKPIPFIGIYQRETVKLYCDLDYWAEVARKIVKKTSQKFSFFAKLLKDSDEVKRESIKILHRYGLTGLNRFSDKQLAADLKILAYNGFLLSVNSQLSQIADISHNIFTSALEEAIQSSSGFKKSGLTVGEVFNILTVSTRNLPSEEAQKELRKLKGKKQLISQYLAKWFWLYYGHLGPSFNRKDIVKQMKNLPKAKNIQALVKKQFLLEKKLGLTAKGKQMFKAVRLFVYLKGMREQVCNGAFSFLNRLAEKISREKKMDKKYLMYLTVNECLGYLRGKKLPAKSVLAKRREFSVWIPKDVFRTKVLIGQEAKEYAKKHLVLKEEKIKAVSEIEGKVAFPGKVVGRVRIINGVNEIGKIKKGEIMVSIQTMPELLPAMNKAVAFVTDIGGITSHAAIVAREMKKPCVIGTRIGTKILKDGDRVEVDATKGVVRKL